MQGRAGQCSAFRVTAATGQPAEKGRNNAAEGTRQGFGRTKARKTKNRTNTKQSAVGRRREREKEERVEAKSDGPELPAF